MSKQLEVKEQLVGVYSVESTTALVLFTVIKDALLRTKLDLQQLRGQCYDGAANMSGKFKGKKYSIISYKLATASAYFTCKS